MSGLVTPTMTETVSGKFIDLAAMKKEDLDIHDIAWSLSRQSRFGGHTMSKTPYSVAQHTVMVSRYVEEALTPGTHLNEVFAKYISSKVSEYAMKGGSDSPDFVKWVKAQESLELIHEEMCRTVSFHGLMHDFAEAYLIDLPTPVKRLPGIYEAYKKFELTLDLLVFETFGLGYGPKQFPETWAFGSTVVAWADQYALLVEGYHLMPSRAIEWGIPLPRPSLSSLYSFRWPISNEAAYLELIDRFEELRKNTHID